MQENQLYSFEYKAKKSSLIILAVVCASLGGLSIYKFVVNENPTSAGIAASLLCLILLWIFFLSKIKKEVRIYDDRLEFPESLARRKIIKVFYENISEASLINLQYGMSSIRIKLKNGKNIEILSAYLDDHAFYEILNHLEKKNFSHELETLPPLEKSKNERKAKKYKWIGFSLFPTFLLASKYFTGNLNTARDWLAIGAVIIVVFALSWLQELASRSEIGHKRANSSILSQPEHKKIKKKWELYLYIPAVMGIIGLVILFKFPYQGSTTILPFLLIGLTISFLILLVLIKIAPDVNKIISQGEKWTAYTFLFISLSLFSVFTALIVNRNLDKSQGEHKITHLTGKWKSERGHFCYRVAHWENGETINAGDEAYCTHENPMYRENDKLEVKVHDGFLGVSWISSVDFIKYRSPEDAIRENGSELELRRLDVEIISKKLGVSVWSSYFTEWNKKCYSENPSYCRLTSYIYNQRGEKELNLKVIRYGCNQKDFRTCYSVFFFKEFSKEEKKIAKTTIIEQCNNKMNEEEKSICDIVKRLN